MRLAFPEFDRDVLDGRAIVTSNRLLATVANHQVELAQLERSLESWHRPVIRTLDAWLSSLWQDVRYKSSSIPALLSPSQERLLWRNLVEAEVPGLFDVESTARLATSAQRTAIEWQIADGDDSWNDNVDAQQFVRWRAAVRKLCQDNGWITYADLLSLAPEWIASGLCKPNPVALVGFGGVITPALQKLLRALSSSATVLKQKYSVRKTRPRAKECSDLPAEIDDAARWARAICEAKSGASVGVLVPALRENLGLVRRTFQDVFDPGAGLDLVSRESPKGLGAERRPAFHIHSAGASMQTPLADTAMLILGLIRPRVETSAAGAILRSLFIRGSEIERSERTLADLELRRFREIDVSLGDLDAVSNACPKLKLLWAAVRIVLRKKRSKMWLAAWSELFGDLLSAMGWPGDLEFSSGEQEAIERWKAALSELAALGFVSGPVNADQALAYLTTVLSESTSDRDDLFAPVQILDAGSSEGLEFDYAVITGSSDEYWPPVTKHLPFLPPRLQRTYGLPVGQAQQLQQEQVRRTELLLHAAPECLVTFSGRLSPLLQQSVRYSKQIAARWGGKTPRQSYHPATLEQFIDEVAPSFAGKHSPRGGTSILKLQSQCPFRAFAEIRLRSQSPEDACFGFDSRDRGGFLHRALQNVWQQLQNQAQLAGMSDSGLREIIDGAVLLAVEDDEKSPFHNLISLTERERLENLIFEWLQVEKSRKQPFTVRTIEQEEYLDLAGMRLRLRIDRVDELNNQKLVLIDYKSGKQTASKLEGERPAEPQLLVYAAALGRQVDGVFFGQIKARELKAVGFSRNKHFDGRSATVKTDWDGYLEQSRKNVEQLATRFVQGEASVDPIKDACSFCGQKPFCRIREQMGSGDEEDD